MYRSGNPLMYPTKPPLKSPFYRPEMGFLGALGPTHDPLLSYSYEYFKRKGEGVERIQQKEHLHLVGADANTAKTNCGIPRKVKTDHKKGIFLKS